MWVNVFTTLLIAGSVAHAGYLPDTGPGGKTVCVLQKSESIDGQTVTLCSDGQRTTQFSNGAVVIDRVDNDGNILRAGTLNHNVAGNTNKDFAWQRNEAYQASDSDCKTGRMIDGKFACAGANTAIKSAEISNIGSQFVGAGALNTYGQQVWQDVAASGGDVATSYEAQAKLMNRAGETQKAMGWVNIGAGAAQIKAYQKAQKNINELKRELSMVEQRVQVNLDTKTAGDGTGANEYGYISGNRGDSRGVIKDQITGKVIENFNLNQVAKVNGIEAASSVDLSYLRAAGVLDANNRYTTNYATPEKRIQAIQNSAKLDANQKRQAMGALRRMQMADSEIGKKKAAVIAQTKQIIQRAISEQTEIAGRTAAGAAVSAAQGMSQIHMGNEQKRTAGSIKDMAEAIRKNGQQAPPIVLNNTQTDLGGSGAGRGGGGLGGNAPDISLAEGQPNPNASPLGGFNGMGDPINTRDNLETQVGPAAGMFQAGMGNMPQGGPTGGGGGGGSVNFGAMPADPQAAAVLPGLGNVDPYKTYGKGGDYKSMAATAGAATGAPGSMADMMEVMKNFGREDGAGNATNTQGEGRAPASAEVEFLSPDADLFKQVSIAYRSKLEAGAVGVVVQP